MDSQIIVTPNDMTFNKKLLCSAIAAIIFIVMSLPQAYTQTSRVTTTTVGMCPTPEGKFIHAALFFVIEYFILKIMASQNWMNLQTKSDALLAKYSFYGTLLFFLISSSDAYQLTGKFISNVADEHGCPEVKGVLIHGVVFLVVLLLVMYFPKDC